ncbi:uncharacterized protein BDZ99DRAFT_428324 [Mytilinidion resinicola]|uniref:Cora-domain-containing protein n=1 Tax=Mytilinidion resinicola TaxID=574789 RepID=A0A6A6Y1A3_9PEZI|nr:uncharacterized protein BDZ99DRAFT_428324 [Mytilinidion resinicola]KAF2802596.1 hypothetical protein BDZ99DRAFT_428324 [Mytilinidion resinicola]
MQKFASSSFSLDDLGTDGAWLCAKGPYLDFIAERCSYDPGLMIADPKNKDHPIKPGNATVVMLEQDHSSLNFASKEFKSCSDLQSYFMNDSASPQGPHPRRRIYIMEGLAQDYISVLGSQFFMNPSFFMRQERTCIWSNAFTPVSDSLPQPSLLEPHKSFMIDYCELRQFPQIIPNTAMFCKRTGRHVGMTPSRHEEKSTTGMLRRKCSFWSRETQSGGWDVVVLCDPQLQDAWNDSSTCATVPNSPFQGGYVDFLPINLTRDAHLTTPKHTRKSMLHDLVFYYTHHAHLIPPADWKLPVAASLFPKKIIAAHYLQLVAYIKAMLPSLELQLSSSWTNEQEQWRTLQTISRRCGDYCDNIEDILLSLGLPLSLPSSTAGSWMDSAKDYQYIRLRLESLKARADTLMAAMTGLASIAGNHQALDEAKRAKRLTLVGLVFIPLAYSTSLFSMTDNFAPGQSAFWVYWVVAVPLIIFTFLVAGVLDLVLDEAGKFSFHRLRRQKTNAS